MLRISEGMAHVDPEPVNIEGSENGLGELKMPAWGGLTVEQLARVWDAMAGLTEGQANQVCVDLESGKNIEPNILRKLRGAA